MSDTRELPLTNGHVALVDAEDFDRCHQFKWRLKRKTNDPNRFYVQRTVRIGTGKDAKKTCITLHRFILDAQPGELVDHRNGDGLDNRRANLRRCTHRENSANVVHSSRQKKGGWKGVYWHSVANKWMAQIAGGEVRPSGKRKTKYLGLFTDPVEAAKAYDRAAIECFGEFASLNFHGPVNDGQDVSVSYEVHTLIREAESAPEPAALNSTGAA